MKKTLLILSLVLITLIFPKIFFDANNFFAQQRGCCMQLNSRTGQYYRNGLNFRQCQELNSNLDRGDNLFERRGYVWWNVNC
jgi:hypothetical protein